MNKQNSDIRHTFETLSPHAIVSRAELAALLNTSEGAISQMIYRRELPNTAFPSKRRACWFAADIKKWLEEQQEPNIESVRPILAKQEISQNNPAKIGRPRSTIEHLR
mgnify:CR=1 FL=1